jgi:hypothetical protein
VSTEKNSTPFDNSPGYFLYVAGDTVTTGTGLGFIIRAGANPTVISYTGTIAQSVWHHVAVTRSGSTVGIYFNGVLVASNTSFSGTVAPASSMEFKIGYRGTVASFLAELNGYISNLPATSALPSAGASLLTCASNRFRDLSTNNFAITRNGDARVADFNPFGTQVANPPSMYFDGTGDYLTAINNPIYDFGTSDFTIEMWFYPAATQVADATLFSLTGGTTYFVIHNNSTSYNDRITVWVDNYGAGTRVLTGNTTFLRNAWYHVAVTRSAGIWRLFLNGVSDSTTYTNTANPTPSSAILYVGARAVANLLPFNGYISDLRITRGRDLYGGFEPPTQPLPVR